MVSHFGRVMSQIGFFRALAEVLSVVYHESETVLIRVNYDLVFDSLLLLSFCDMIISVDVI